jgi:serine protease Do
MTELYENFRNALIQIATPWGSGTGFYLYEYNLIVTNLHVTSGANEVVISGVNIPKTISSLLFSDPVFDLAFIKAPENVSLSKISLGQIEEVNEGDDIIAMGHPYGLKFTATKGIISKAKRNWNGHDFIQIDAAINPGNSGGPLIDKKNKIIGVNTFILADGVNLGFALPVNYLEQSLKDYMAIFGQFAYRCNTCENIFTKTNEKNYYCPHCGEKIPKEEFEGKKFVPSAIGSRIEDIITKLNYDVRIARIGYNFWEIDEGSATIRISYDEDDGYIFAYTILCKLPKQNIAPIYEYLLKENNYMKGLSFSIVQQDVILTMMQIFEEDLHVESGAKLFKYLFNKADDYDDILIDMGAIPLNSDE